MKNDKNNLTIIFSNDIIKDSDISIDAKYLKPYIETIYSKIYPCLMKDLLSHSLG